MEKLTKKMNKRIGMRAVTSDNMKPGTITGYHIEGDKVIYLICYDGRDKVLRRVDESIVVLMKDVKA